MVYDVLIAGAGPAGCAAAYDLARAGKRVLLLDRRSFPRPKACACGLTRKTLKALRYAVDPVVERVCHEIVLQRAGDGAAGAAPLADKGLEVRVRTRSPICALAVRERFDAFCLEQTLAAGRAGGGVEMLKIESILALEEGEDAVTLTVSTADGPRSFSAPVLVGADGSNGQTRRLAEGRGQGAGPREQGSGASEPGWYSRGFALEATIPYAALPARLPEGDGPHDLVFDFAPLPGGYGWLFPKGDHVNIGVGTFADGDPASLKRVTRELLAAYTAQKLGVSLGSFPASITTGQHLGMGGHAYVPRGRVLLAGDAAGLVDPLTGEGIHSAIVSGQAAAAAVLPGGDVAAAYARELAPLQQTLAFSVRAARAFYAQPERGFKAMRIPLLRGLVLKTYADGLPHTRLLKAISRLV